MANVLVTGGTGVLGRKLVADLLARGHAVRVLSRRTVPEVPEGATAVTGDLEADVGLAEALAGVETVVHSASDPRQRVDADVTGTDHLLRAARAAGEPHVLYVSIVGCARIPIGYYRAKTVAELAVTESGLPWTVQRTTQFHDLVFALAYAVSRLPVVPVPRGVRVQPIDVRDLAPRIADLVEAGPAGRAPDLGGPEVHDL
ncbi:MAG TPA: NAD(P)H-binding protein, partial [Actinopolymorphaceae bacterium]